MTQIIHLANTDFEFELAQPHTTTTIQESWQKHPFCLQLQYLPLLYAQQDESIVVTHVPDDHFLENLSQCEWRKKEKLPRFHLLEKLQSIDPLKCLSWGHSQRVQKWCDHNSIEYRMPSWDVTTEINSKAFSFDLGTKFAESALIHHAEELETWLKKTKGLKKVLKTCFGLSGRGHFFIDDTSSIETIHTFCQKEWEAGRPLIGEPWVNRFFDFSTQWWIDPNGEVKLIGPTVFESNQRGKYQATLAGPVEALFGQFQPFLDEHINIVEEALKKVVSKGYFGHLGVDAFLYRDAQNEIQLHPIVEINGRQTMSWAALMFQRKWFSTQKIRLAFASLDSNVSSLLPQQCGHIKFRRQLIFNKIV